MPIVPPVADSPFVPKEIIFPIGLPGFPARRAFDVDEVNGTALALLVAKDNGGPTFLVLTVPTLYFPDLRPFAMDAVTAEVVGATESSDLISWLIVTPRSDGATVNLLGPLVVNLGTSLAVQVVRKDLSLPVAAPLPSLEDAHA